MFEKDYEDVTFELSLFAEVFQEMLQYQMGSQILASLEALRKISIKRTKNQKRLREDNKEKEEDEGQPTLKWLKLSDKKTSKGNTKGDNTSSKHVKDEKDDSNQGISQELRSSCEDEEDDRDELFAIGRAAVVRKIDTIQ